MQVEGNETSILVAKTTLYIYIFNIILYYHIELSH